MQKYTKIVATVSDKRCSVEFIKSLFDAGVNVVRMNSAHLDYEGFKKIVENTRAANKSIAIMMDTKGPEIRTTVTADGNAVVYHTDDIVTISGNPDGITTHDCICLNYPAIAPVLKPGDRLLIDDGEMEFEIVSVEKDIVTARANNDGEVGSRKSVNIPGVRIDLPAVTERDRRNIGYAVELGVDFIAHSFVRSAADVMEVQAILDTYGTETKIISKIENQEGIDNFDAILTASYGIMVARGDLGIEVAAERIPGIQAMLINKCIRKHKPVIVATQMLHTMIEHPRPTRAEISDVANAVYQRADAMMLSGETAYGKYPVEAVSIMTSVAREVESSLRSKMDVPPLLDADITSFLAHEAVLSETKVGTKAIFTDAYRGRSARYIASFRGNNPTFAICHNRNVQRWLALSYGVAAFYYPQIADYMPHLSVEAVNEIVESGRLRPTDRLAYLTGTRDGARALEILTPEEIVRNGK
ncbi:pyruvate kinase [Lepagella muris]|uniref:Pyruvate kinase n=1 Tax=Lepagella muris TaxID=3032870 RepID=A0AC61RGS7_9BACT|nr:pyruvate kinase [Lepagella muris]TGY78885.1 pyruvate kinase [Lepagella muris]THG52325.1 pyruvate kinase [Bacteroidales bacterium]